MDFIMDESKEIPVWHKADVVVVGGGTAGTIAAVAAARQGARTVLMERCGVPGGVPTTGLMASMGNRLCDDGMKKYLGGIPWEVMERLVEEGGTRSPDMKETLVGQLGKSFSVPFQPEILSYVLLKMLKEAGVDVMLHTHFSHVVGSGPRPAGVVAVNKSGRGAILARVLIDASGDADLAAAAGVPCVKDPFTWGLLMRLGNVDFDRLMKMIYGTRAWEPCPEFDAWLSQYLGMPVEQIRQDKHWKHIIHPIEFGHAPVNDPGDTRYSPEKLEYIRNRWEKDGYFYNIEMPVIRHLLKQAVDAGDLELVKDIEGFGKIWLGFDGFAGGAWGPGVSLVNACSAARGFDGTDGLHVSRAEMEGRIYCVEIARFFKKYVPGYENSFIIDIGSQFVHRSSRMIEGRCSINAGNMKECFSGSEDAIYMLKERLGSSGDAIEIPYSVLVPKNVDNMLVAGKCAWGSRYFRSIVSCMAMGQAAGTAAYMMASSGVSNREVDVRRLQDLLRKDGVILDNPGRT